jgi:TfoX/Sxy family transcriptional regulator of competence genes
MTILERLTAALAREKVEARRMFSGTGFMRKGNLLIGTHKDGLIVRVGKDASAAAARKAGASVMVMNGKAMEGWIIVEGSAVKTEASLRSWIDAALAFNATLLAKAAKPAKKPRAKRS